MGQSWAPMIECRAPQAARVPEGREALLTQFGPSALPTALRRLRHLVDLGAISGEGTGTRTQDTLIKSRAATPDTMIAHPIMCCREVPPRRRRRFAARAATAPGTLRQAATVKKS